MSFESEIFKRCRPNYKKLTTYGFSKNKDKYTYSKVFMDDQFRADIVIDNKGTVTGKVIEIELDEEYVNFRIEDQVGEFVGRVREEYKNILQDILDSCFEKEYFVSNQANRITKLIFDKYKDSPEFLWKKFMGDGIFRNPKSKKWYGIIMIINKSKLEEGASGEVEVLNVKLNADMVEKLLREKGFYESYHMKKSDWITILLDDTVSDEKIMQLIDISYLNTSTRNDAVREWIIPANPRYYDVVHAFDDVDTIIWKQSNNILVGDIVYLYVGDPYSAILFKCSVVEVDIPYVFKNKDVSMTKVMKIKLLKRYNENDFTFKKLNDYGIKAVRGPRGLSKELSKALSKG